MSREIMQGFAPKTLAQVQVAKIIESKIKLDEFLAANPFPSKVKGGKERLYSVTRDKQALLTGEVMLAQGAAAAGIKYTAKWNAAGQPCEAWTAEELMGLAYGVSAYVKPFVSYQQDIEVAVNACKTVRDVEAIIIDYMGVTR